MEELLTGERRGSRAGGTNAGSRATHRGHHWADEHDRPATRVARQDAGACLGSVGCAAVRRQPIACPRRAGEHVDERSHASSDVLVHAVVPLEAPSQQGILPLRRTNAPDVLGGPRDVGEAGVERRGEVIPLTRRRAQACVAQGLSEHRRSSAQLSMAPWSADNATGKSTAPLGVSGAGPVPFAYPGDPTRAGAWPGRGRPLCRALSDAVADLTEAAHRAALEVSDPTSGHAVLTRRRRPGRRAVARGPLGGSDGGRIRPLLTSCARSRLIAPAKGARAWTSSSTPPGTSGRGC